MGRPSCVAAGRTNGPLLTAASQASLSARGQRVRVWGYRVHRSFVMVVAILLALTTTSAPARAAGVTGLYLDGFNDPLTDGVQTLYEAPAATLSVVGGSSGRRIIVFETNVDGWRLTFGTPDGPELHTGPHQPNLAVQREGHACELWGTDVAITELTWGPADVLESFAANFDYGCRPSSGFTGEIRYNASSPIKALATDSVDVDLGETEAGDPGTTSYVTVSNIGHVPVALDAPVVEGPDIQTHGGTCVPGPLAAGASCTVGVRLTGLASGLARQVASWLATRRALEHETCSRVATCGRTRRRPCASIRRGSGPADRCTSTSPSARHRHTAWAAP